jgi:hypothetical protein
MGTDLDCARCRDEPAAAPNDERVSEDMAESRECVAHGRLRDVQASRCLRRAPFFENRVENEEQVEIDPSEIHNGDTV